MNRKAIALIALAILIIGVASLLALNRVATGESTTPLGVSVYRYAGLGGTQCTVVAFLAAHTTYLPANSLSVINPGFATLYTRIVAYPLAPDPRDEPTYQGKAYFTEYNAGITFPCPRRIGSRP